MRTHLLETLNANLWIQNTIDNLRARILDECRNPNSPMAAHIDALLTKWACTNTPDALNTTIALEKQLLDTLTGTLPTLQKFATKHIETTIQSWSASQLTHELEQALHNDLQFIRLSGTFVGGTLGLAIHAAALALS